MRIISNPIVWLARIRNRCGYGVHSPFAFRFITEVIYERSPYYAYAHLSKRLRWWQRFRVAKVCQLLFRIANYQQPRLVLLHQPDAVAIPYIIGGCRKAEVVTIPDGRTIDLCYLTRPDDAAVKSLSPQGVLIVDSLSRNRTWFRNLPYAVAFDLHDVGIAFFDHRLHKHYYKVNFE